MINSICKFFIKKGCDKIMNSNKKNAPKTIEEKRIISKKNIFVWEKIAIFLDKLYFFMLGIFWMAISIFVARYYIGPFLIIPVCCSISFWQMMFSDQALTLTICIIEEPQSLTSEQREMLKAKINELD